MWKMKTRIKRKNGFTLLELLVVIAIIAMLIGVLTVGMRKTKMIATNLRQKAILKAMDTGLELFSKDFNGYPDSRTLLGPSGQVCGAQHLFEALVGRDEAGCEPRTNWYAPDPTAYSFTAPPGYYDSTNMKSANRRRGPYGDYKHVGFYTIYDLWGSNNGSSAIYDSEAAGLIQAQRAPVFTDTFQRKRVTLPNGDGVKVGMPILYFKADRGATRQFRLDGDQNEVTNPVGANMIHWTYNYQDNMAIMDLPNLEDPSTLPPPDHYVDPEDAAAKSKAQVFYELITHRSDPDRPFFKPFNPNTFLLISAGWDGVYGTADDITNFDY